jgi:small subunit ribosomal protein S20
MGLASFDPNSRTGGARLAKRSKSGLKRKRQAVKRTARNQAVRSTIKTLVKQARRASTVTSAEVRAAIREIDTAARKGIIHPNAAARSKSRLIRHLAHQGTATPA